MQTIKSFGDLVIQVKNGPTRRVAVVAGHDPASIEAAAHVAREMICHVTLVADRARGEALCREKSIDMGLFEILEEKDEGKACTRGIELVRSGHAQVLMKGLVGTDKYMHGILDKERGLVPKGATLTHITLFELPHYHKLLLGSDCAVLPLPTLEQKIAIIQYAVAAARKLGVDKPKVALIGASEKVSEKMVASLDAAVISKMAERGQIKGAIVDGPLSLDVALDKDAATLKEVSTPVAGDSDILVFPNLEAGNVFYKSATKLAHGRNAAFVAGASAPCVLTSRADDEDSKFHAIVLACLLG
jgi:phosphate butyryltransferase